MVKKLMKAIVIYEAGGPEKLIYKEVPVPEVKPGWSLIRIMGRGVNHSEIFTREGQSPSVQFPRILGIECVGVIAETTDPARLPEGQKVISIMGEMGRAFDGGYAEYALLPNHQIYPVSTNLPWETLAALRDTFAHTAEGGVICVTGLLGGKWTLEDFDPLEDMPVNGYLTAFHSGNVTEQSLQEMLDFVAAHEVDCRPEKVFDLSEMVKAHEYLGSSRSFGKVVVMS